MTNQPQPTYTTLLTTLLTTQHKFYSPPTSPLRPLLGPSSSQIPTLSLHPTLEAALHIINADLPSAHFLLRHAQAAPAHESMYLHGILHRVEGDVDNARAWYGDVQGQEVFVSVWGGEEWRGFLGRVERWRDRGRKRRGKEIGNGIGNGDEEKVDWEREERELNAISLREIKGVIGFCERKFGTGRVEDATGEYTMSGEKHSEIAAKMIMGGEGWREF